MINFFKRKLLVGLICRCKDEFFIEEFATYYLAEGIDHIYIIDDNSNDKSIYRNILNNPRVDIIFEKNIIENNYVNKLYKSIRNKFKWMVYVDSDEFITTKKFKDKTIRDTLKTIFKDVHCVKIPWVMMSSNGLKQSPKHILKTNIFRWNHDFKHENVLSKHHKFRCRYDEIEVKCIFKTKFFKSVWDHHPKEATVPIDNLKIVDGVEKKKSLLNPFYKNLREHNIERAYLLCYHYRIISEEHSMNKLKTNKWYIDNGYDLKDLMSSDYSEVKDETLKNKMNSNY